MVVKIHPDSIVKLRGANSTVSQVVSRHARAGKHCYALYENYLKAS